MKIEFRKANKADAELLIEIYNAAFYSDHLRYGACPAYGKTREAMEQSIMDYAKFLILYDSRPAGCISCRETKRGTYMEAFAALGYRPEQVTAILLTHKHNDHSGELKSFPNAKIYAGAEETAADELKDLPNLVPVTYTDGAYYNFPESQKIRDGIWLIRAKGHTCGNSIVIVEKDGLFYMLHGDITYVDEALHQDKLSVVFEDLPAARETLDRVREFVRSHPTVYCGTHTPQGYENLEAKRVMDLEHPVSTVLAEVDFSAKEASGKYVCSVCGYVYDPEEHDGVAFEDLPDDWRCPRCKRKKEKFTAL